MKTEIEIKALLPDLFEEIREAKEYFSTWRSLTAIENEESYELVMEQHSQLFNTIISSLFTSLIVTLYRIYDSNSKTYTLRKVYDASLEQGLINENIKDEAIKLNTNILSDWRKICILRSNVFGHKSSKLSPDEAFSLAKLTPNEIESMISSTQELYNFISKSLNNGTDAFYFDRTDDIQRVMHLLNSNNASNV